MNNEKLNSTPKLSIAKREIFRICKDPVYFFCMLVAPTICVVFFLSLMKEGLPTDMPVAVVDLDGSSNSRNLARQLDAFEQTKVMLTTVSFEEARQAMQEGKVYGIFYIPRTLVWMRQQVGSLSCRSIRTVLILLLHLCCFGI